MNETKLLVVIVDKYKEETVLERALNNGASSGVILVGRGTGDPKQLRVFGIHIQPEKRVVLLAVTQDKIKQVQDALNEKLGFSEPNHGISFVLPTKKAIGLGGLE